MDKKAGVFQIKIGENKQGKFTEAYEIRHHLKNMLVRDPEVIKAVKDIEAYLEGLFTLKANTGKTSTVKLSLGDIYSGRAINLDVLDCTNDMLMAAANKESRFDPRPFGNIHCVLLELLKVGGSARAKETLYLRSLRDAEVHRLLVSDLLALDRGVFSLKAGAIEYLDRIATRKPVASFNIGCRDLRRSFYAIVSGLGQNANYVNSIGGEASQKLVLHRWILEKHQIINGNQPTKIGQKFLARDLFPFLVKSLTHYDWFFTQGPTPGLYFSVGYYDYHKFETFSVLRADHTLLHAVPGIAAPLLSALPESRREYPRFLLQYKSYDDLIHAIANLREKNPEILKNLKGSNV